ncbi:hypothetical protein ACJX0J_014409, partial [Zea mays]
MHFYMYSDFCMLDICFYFICEIVYYFYLMYALHEIPADHILVYGSLNKTLQNHSSLFMALNQEKSLLMHIWVIIKAVITLGRELTIVNFFYSDTIKHVFSTWEIKHPDILIGALWLD